MRYQQVIGEQFEANPTRIRIGCRTTASWCSGRALHWDFVDAGVESYGGTSIFLEAHKPRNISSGAIIGRRPTSVT